MVYQSWMDERICLMGGSEEVMFYVVIVFRMIITVGI